MKKLIKANTIPQDTIEAYACNCSACQSCGPGPCVNNCTATIDTINTFQNNPDNMYKAQTYAGTYSSKIAK